MALDPRDLAADLAALLPDMLSMTERVVNIDSGSYAAAGVNQVQDAFAEQLSELGFTITRRKLPDRGDQMTGVLKPGGRGPRVLVIGHADTVWPAGTVAAWPFRRDGNAITGPGVGDMKSCVVMALFALRALKARGALDGLAEVRVIIVPDEELGSPQSRGWIEDEARQADAALTLEPCRPGGGVVTGRGAVGAVYITAEGVSAHTGSARDKGASAVAALAPLVERIEGLTRLNDGVIATVGIFRGGAARQVVPHEAEIHLDLRAPTDETAAALLSAVKAIAATPPSDPRVKVHLRGGFGRPAFPRSPGTVALFQTAERIAARIGAPIFEVQSRGGSDGSFAAALGLPTLDGLGPITHETVSRREWVEVDSIVPRGALFGGLVASLAERPEILRR